MTPAYHYPIYSSFFISLLGGSQVYYDLDEDKGWIVTKESLGRRFNNATSRELVIKAMNVVNPAEARYKSFVVLCQSKDYAPIR